MRAPFDEHKMWTSRDEIDVLDHRSNFSNWTEFSACRGYWELRVDASEAPPRLDVRMPMTQGSGPQLGHYILFTGIVEVEEHEILLVNDGEIFERFSYKATRQELHIEILGTEIVFVPGVTCPTKDGKGNIP